MSHLVGKKGRAAGAPGEGGNNQETRPASTGHVTHHTGGPAGARHNISIFMQFNVSAAGMKACSPEAPCDDACRGECGCRRRHASGRCHGDAGLKGRNQRHERGMNEAAVA
ncbi:hypothetical protein E2C01_084458 [Portunus trituberculatus]|uniref:Uncharacterized protein n=1 Tax=Portunus trituberculatus TaxID=210409 RepID=A0A5B7J7K6_PORTR|nr:hypothetical protein [Portunus trituberculatus]